MYECGNAFSSNFGNELTFAFNLKRNKIIGTQYFENKPIWEMHVSISNFEQNNTFKNRLTSYPINFHPNIYDDM